MTLDVHATTVASGCHLFSGCGYPSPRLEDFTFKPIFSIGPWHVTKPELLKASRKRRIGLTRSNAGTAPE